MTQIHFDRLVLHLKTTKNS